MDENRRKNVYAWVYYGVRAFCLLLCGLALAAVAFFLLPAGIGLARDAQGPWEILLCVLLFVLCAMPAAVCLLTAVRLARRFRTMNSDGTSAMAFVLAVLSWCIFSSRLDAALPRLEPGMASFYRNENVKTFLPLLAAWGVFVVSRSVLTIVANRSLRQAPQAAPTD